MCITKNELEQKVAELRSLKALKEETDNELKAMEREIINYMTGVDDISNIWITCLPCNKFKDNLLPEDYGDRITKSFLYQAERKCKSKIKWRLLSALVGSM